MLTETEKARLEELERNNSRLISWIDSERDLIEEYTEKLNKLKFFGIGKFFNKDKIEVYERGIRGRSEHIASLLSTRANDIDEYIRLVIKEAIPKKVKNKKQTKVKKTNKRK